MKQQLQTTGKQRDPYFDNARFFLVTLVVLGHLISPVREANDTLFFMNNFLSSFRMPALVLVSGFFTKHFSRDPRRFVKQLLLTLLVPYLVFQVFYLRMDGLAETWGQLVVNLFAPNFGMWFLLSLLFWNLLLFPFAKLRHPILVAFILGVVIGWVDAAGEFLSISRTFVFFPIFLIGHHLQKGQFSFFKERRAKGLAVVAIVLNASILSFFSLEQARNALLARHPFVEIADSLLEGTVLRLVFYVVMLLGIVAFLPWVPKKRISTTYLGRRTAYVYLLHLFFVKLFTALNWFPEQLGLSFILILPVVWLSIVYWTSSNAVVFFTRPFVEGKWPQWSRQSPLVMRRNP